MPASEPLSFQDFVEQRKPLSPKLRAAFEAAIRLAGGTFNYRTEAEWEREFQLFSQADRRRRPHG